MAMSELEYILRMLEQAQHPEQVFGKLTGNNKEQLDAAKSSFRKMARKVHPDHQQGTDRKRAHDAFVVLNEMYKQAEVKIQKGTYGDVGFSMPGSGRSTSGSKTAGASSGSKTSGSGTSRSSGSSTGSGAKTGGTGRTGATTGSSSGANKKRSTTNAGSSSRHSGRSGGGASKTYSLKFFSHLVNSGGIADIYTGQIISGKHKMNVLAKISRDPADNDLLEKEAVNIRQIRNLCRDRHEIFLLYMPEVIDSYTLTDKGKDSRRITLLSELNDYCTLEYVIRKKPQGINPQTIASLVNRLLEILGFAHQYNIVNGAVLPNNILVHPPTNLLVLLDWSAATTANGYSHIRLMDSAYEDFYPQDVPERRPARPEIDIYMAAMCGLALSGGNASDRRMGWDNPKKMKKFLESLVSSDSAPNGLEAWQVRSEFEQVQKRIFSRPAYQPFSLAA